MAKKIYWAIFILSLGFNLAILVHWGIRNHPCEQNNQEERAQGERNHGHHDWKGVYKKIGVTDEDCQKLEPLMQQLGDETKSFREKFHTLQGEMLTLLSEPTPAPEALEKKRMEIATAQEDFQKLLMRHFLDQKKILTPEQQKKFFEQLRVEGVPGNHRSGMMSSPRPKTDKKSGPEEEKTPPPPPPPSPLAD